MAYTYESNNSTTEGVGKSLEIPALGLSADTGNLMLLFVGTTEVSSSPATPTTPSGWTVEFSKQDNDLRVVCFKRIATADGETYPDIVMTGTDSEWTIGGFVFTDTDTTTDTFSIGATAVTQRTVDGTYTDNPDITTEKANSWILSMMWAEDATPLNPDVDPGPNFIVFSDYRQSTGSNEGEDHTTVAGIEFTYESASTVISGVDWEATGDDYVALTMEIFTNGNTAPPAALDYPTETFSYTNGNISWLTALRDSGVNMEGDAFPQATISGEDARLSFNTSSAVNGTTDEITITSHPFVKWQKVKYEKSGGSDNIGLTDSTFYTVEVIDANTIKLWQWTQDLQQFTLYTPMDLTAGSGETHYLDPCTVTTTAAHGITRSRVVFLDENTGSLDSALTDGGFYWAWVVSDTKLQLVPCGAGTATDGKMTNNKNWFFTAGPSGRDDFKDPLQLTKDGSGTCYIVDFGVFADDGTFTGMADSGQHGSTSFGFGLYKGDNGFNQNYEGVSAYFSTPRDMSSEILTFEIDSDVSHYQRSLIVFIDSDGDWIAWRVVDIDVDGKNLINRFTQIEPGSTAVQEMAYSSFGTFNAASVSHIVNMNIGNNKQVSDGNVNQIGSPGLINPLKIYGGLSTAPVDLAQVTALFARLAPALASQPSDLQFTYLGSLQIGATGESTFFSDSEKSVAFPPLANGTTRLATYREVVGFDFLSQSGDELTLKNSQIGASGPFRVDYTLSGLATHNFDGNTYVFGNVNLDVDDTFSRQLFVGGNGIIDNGAEVRNSTLIVNVDVPADDGMITWRSSTDISGCAFEAADDLVDGHAIIIETPGTYTFDSLTFTGFGANGTDTAALFNNSGGSVTINVTGGGQSPTVRNGSGASTTVQNAVTLEVTGLETGARVRIEETDGTLISDGTESGGEYSDSYNYGSDTPVFIIVRLYGYLPIRQPATITSAGLAVQVQMVEDTIVA